MRHTEQEAYSGESWEYVVSILFNDLSSAGRGTGQFDKIDSRRKEGFVECDVDRNANQATIRSLKDTGNVILLWRC